MEQVDYKPRDGPTIELGCYRHATAESHAMDQVLRLLRNLGFARIEHAIGIKKVDGAAQRLAWVHYFGVAASDFVSIREPTFDAILEPETWTPTCVRLVRVSPAVPLEVEVQYEPIAESSLRAGDAHPLSVTLSGADLDLVRNWRLGNTPGYQPDRDVVERASATEVWCDNTFRHICTMLRPDYASHRQSSGLLSPSALRVSENVHDFDRLYVPTWLARRSNLEARIQRLSKWNVVAMAEGAFYSCSLPIDSTNVDVRLGRDLIRSCISALLASKERTTAGEATD